MKQFYTATKAIIALLFLTALTLTTQAQNNVGIGTTTPNPKAVLELQATDKGLLVPRLTTAQMNAITTPPNGLLVYNTTQNCFNYYNTTTLAWKSMCSTTGITNSGDTVIINLLKADSIFANYLTVNNAFIKNLFATYIKADSAYIKNLVSNYIKSDSAYIKLLRTDSIFTNYLHAHYIVTDSIYAQLGRFDSLVIKGLSIDSLIKQITSNYLNSKDTVVLKYLRADSIYATLIKADSAFIKHISSNYIKADTIVGGWGKFDSLYVGGKNISQIITDSIAAQAWLLKGNTGTNTTINKLGTLDARDLHIVTNNTKRISIMSGTGNVGIGQTLPAEKLDVIGNIKTTGSIEFGKELKPAGLSGTTGDVLISQGAGVAPKWVLPSALGVTGPAGANGTNGLRSLINTTIEPAGVNCPNGGQKIESGIDTNNDAVLQAGEVTNTAYTCNGSIGSNGTNGTNGLKSLVSTTTEPAGVNCPNGGQKIESGTDTNNDAVLQTGEVSNTSYTCNGANGALNAWALLGNAGTTAGTNFIGTTDNQDLIFKRNGGQAGLLNTSLLNTSFGDLALNSTTTGSSNAALGNNALRDLTSGVSNTAAGTQAMQFTTTGFANVAMGTQTMLFNTTGQGNAAVGTYSLRANTTGVENTVMGTVASANNTTGSYNATYGKEALSTNTTGDYNVALGYYAGRLAGIAGSKNNFIGANANPTLTNLTNATAIGYNAKVGASNSMALGGTGADAVKVGIGTATPAQELDVVGNVQFSQALMPNANAGTAGQLLTSAGTGVAPTWINANTLPAPASAWNILGNAGTTAGTNFLGTTDNVDVIFKRNGVQSGLLSTNFNTSFGVDALKPTSVGSNNTAIGGNSLKANFNGNTNTAVGSFTLFFNTTGGLNTAIGGSSLLVNTSGNNNTAIGLSALGNNTSGNENTALGFRTALYIVNTTANPNIAIGANALFGGDNSTPANNTASDNVAIGYNAMYGTILNPSTGTQNVAVGNNSLNKNTSGFRNTAIGQQALEASTTGQFNTGVGYYSLQLNTSGAGNAALGNEALGKVNASNYNTAIGSLALRNTTSGFQNTSLGAFTGQVNTLGNNNTFIGYNADASINNLTKAVAIGYNSIVGASNSMVLGGTGGDAVKVGIGTATPAQELDVVGNVQFSKALMPNANAGTAGQLLTSAGAGVAPTWINANTLPAPASAWNILGNTGTIAGTNFLGTTDNVDVVFKRNGVQSGLLNKVQSNTSFGINALNPATTGSQNIALGENALSLNTAGNQNIAIGQNALRINTTGNNNIAIGEGALTKNTTGRTNTANGSSALTNNTTGSNNNANGFTALFYNTTGSYNIANGSEALLNTTTGSQNIAIGAQSLYSNTTGSNNTIYGFGSAFNIVNVTANPNIAIGAYALAGGDGITRTNNTANDNVAIGYNAMKGITGTPSTGTLNVAVGNNAMERNTSGTQNVAVGKEALWFNTSGSYNTATGFHALYGNTTGQYNSAFGTFVLNNNTTGNSNVGVGYSTLQNNTIGTGNTGIGYLALSANITANSTTAVGYQALMTSTGAFNTAVGASALGLTTTGTENTAMGTAASQNNTTGSYNTTYGRGALTGNTTGNYNLALGYFAGNIAGTVGNNNNFIGAYADATTINLTNATAIGYNAKVGASNSMVLGGTGVDAVKVGINTTTPTERLEIQGSVKIVDGTQGAGKVLTSDAAGKGSWQASTGNVGGFVHYLGEDFNGGIIYYLYKGSDGLEHGLVVSKTESTAVWQASSTFTNANRTEDGSYNTTLMTSSAAATYVTSLGAGWYLPSIDELNLLYYNRYSAQKGLRAGSFTLLSAINNYWSSTEYDTGNAYFFYFTGGYSTGGSKNNTFSVRGVRAF